MNPFHFGSADRALFGIHQPPAVRGLAPRGVVLCYPFGVEYMRSHRAFRQLTTLLARKGFHVLRFDYFGTGDSMGSGEDASVEGWTGDAGSAITELADMAGLEQVSVVGLRLGAPLALGAAAHRDDVDRVLLWDPVVSGARWLEEVLPGEGPGNPAGPGSGQGETVGVSGFPVTESFRKELQALHTGRVPVTPGAPVDVVVSRDEPAFRELARELEGRGADAAFHLVPSQGNWAEGDAFGSALLPQGIIQAMVDLLVSGRGAGVAAGPGSPEVPA
ncbi:MAG: hypothetical protein EA352_12675 [Gemmatimonadales bacterium]|nr:MAG: hypothetical protein EA352_12675 [Gemmatimonadales bacterium]